MDPDQTLFASILKLIGNVRQLFAADESGRLISDVFFVGPSRVNRFPAQLHLQHNLSHLLCHLSF